MAAVAWPWLWQFEPVDGFGDAQFLQEQLHPGAGHCCWVMLLGLLWCYQLSEHHRLLFVCLAVAVAHRAVALQVSHLMAGSEFIVSMCRRCQLECWKLLGS